MPTDAVSPMGRTALMLVCMTLVLLFLYWAKPVVIPLALAILLTFLLAPAVSWLQRLGAGRVPAVTLVVAGAMAVAVGIGWLVTQQVGSLVETYPQYEKNIVAKIKSLREGGRGGMIEKIQRAATRIATELERGRPAPDLETPSEQEARTAQPVRVVDDPGPVRLSEVWAMVAPLLAPLATFGLVVVLVVFMLINREDLRDRFLALIGQRQLADTTRAFDDAGERISRYLLAQLLINAGFGVAVGIGLWAIGIPYAPLWGFFAAIFRYIPYLGPVLGALLPIAMSLLIEQNWNLAFLVLALFLALETITNLAVEPYVYGRGIGVSQAALLVAIAFWTWYWGAAGLVLASPLTVCLVVLGRHVPFLRFFDVMLGDRPALEPPYRFYQRLLAHDLDEAAELAEAYAQANSPVAVYDDLAVPALALARIDRRGGKLDAGEQAELARDLRTVIDTAAPAVPPPDEADAGDRGESGQARSRVLLVPARDEADEVAAFMLSRADASGRFEWHQAPAAQLTSDALDRIEREAPSILCVVSVPPGGLAHSRYLCKRARARFPGIRIVVARCGLLAEGREKSLRQLRAAGADGVTFSLADTVARLRQLSLLAPAKAAAEPPDA